MAPSYLKGANSPRRTPQSAPIPGREAEMAANNAGGYVFQVTPEVALRRFLILGTEGGTYYATQQRHTEQAARAVRAALDELKTGAVDLIVDVSVGGRAPKNDPALYALAVAAGHDDPAVRKAALDALPKVARTGTHLFTFLDLVQDQRGWGRSLKRAVCAWYTREDVAAVAYQAVKYRQRDGWTHRDALRLAKPKPPTPVHDELFSWVVGKGGLVAGAVSANVSGKSAFREDAPLRVVEAFERAQRAATPAETAALVGEYGGTLPREAIQTEHLNDPGVWEALLDVGMPMTAMLRNLATMTRHGVLRPMDERTRLVCHRLTDRDALRRARVHPLSILAALATYQSGKSARGDATWTPVGEVVDALDAAFYQSFEFVEPTGKRTMLALDVSGSMTWGTLAGYPGVTPAVGAACMALVTAKVGDPYMVFGFGTQFAPIALSPRQRLDDAVRTIYGKSFGGTDCALPMVYAQQNRLEVDTFVVYTDSETWAGRVQPVQALASYRQTSGIDARLVVVGMTSTDFTIADPRDPGMLDVVGFDTAAPSLISEFSMGRV